MAIPKGLEINNIVGLFLLLGIAILSSKVAECAPFGSRRGLMETVFDVTKHGARPDPTADSTRVKPKFIFKFLAPRPLP